MINVAIDDDVHFHDNDGDTVRKKKKILATMSPSSATASINFQTHFWWVLGSTAPLSDLPTVAHPGPCFGYTLKNVDTT